MVVIVVVVLLAAAVAGFLARRLVHGTRSPEHPLARAEGVTVSELVVPARTLAALVLAFVVVSVYDSFVDAQAQTAAEAGAVLSMAESPCATLRLERPMPSPGRRRSSTVESVRPVSAGMTRR